MDQSTNKVRRMIETNLEINDILKGESIIGYIKAIVQRLVGYVERIERETIPKSMIQGEIIETRRRIPRRR